MANIAVSYTDIQHVANQLRTGESGIKDDLRRLAGIVTQLTASGYITTVSSPAFERTYESFTKSADTMISSMNGLAQYLDVVVRELEDLDRRLAQGLNQS
jgi:uncharacterized protein YukE